ncbi:hypothetical protein AwDysgo_21150 [Bacteroidales bacterium]|nr:hypothetical protein AwDysgo_21150 [Bacteroidales bacterium]
MSKLTVKLKQHTPLIHFQHEQEGATLRASEVKPKLDRFILARLGKGDREAGIKDAEDKGWLVGSGQHPALDYKMKFIISEKPKISIINEVAKDRSGQVEVRMRPSDKKIINKLKPYPLFFANMDADNEDPSEYKCFSFLNKQFEMQLFSFKSDLIEYLISLKTEGEKLNLFADFFQRHNFGTRQSKGFGSFYIDKEDSLYEEIDLKYRFSIDFDRNLIWKDLFDPIDLLYKSLRGGITEFRGGTKKLRPAISIYAENQNQSWDKDLIKSVLFERGRARSGYLFKEMLGLSTNENWIKQLAIVTKSHKDKVIERFKSPIFIKPIQEDGSVNVFIDSEKINPKYCEKLFIVSNRNNSIEMSTLSSDKKTNPHFDLDEFLEFALLDMDLKTIEEKFSSLAQIYKKIRRGHE